MAEPPAASRSRANPARGAHGLVFAGCLVLGLAEWSFLAVGRTSDGTGAFLSAALTTALIAGVVFEGRAAGISVATFAAPFAAASWTAPRGDNDGLWGLIFHPRRDAT